MFFVGFRRAFQNYGCAPEKDVEEKGVPLCSTFGYVDGI